MIQPQNKNKAFHRQSDDCEVAAASVAFCSAKVAKIHATFAERKATLCVTLFSLAILLCGFYNTATAQEDMAPANNKKTMLLKDAGVVQKADEAPKMQAVRPDLQIRRDINNPNAAPDFLKPLVNIELSFIKRVCDPTDEQMTEIVSAAKEALQNMGDIVTPPPPGQNADPANQEVFRGPNQERMYQNPYFRVREEIGKTLKPLVSEKQYARYLNEAQARDLYERDAAVETIVEMLDKRLMLSPDQQSQVHEILIEEATLPDLQTLRSYASNPQYLPSLTKGLIEPVLEPSQKQVWDSLNHVRVIFGQHLQVRNQSGFTEEWLK